MHTSCYVFTLLLLTLSSCSFDSTKRIDKKLDIILKDDLRVIIEDVSKENLIDTPYYTIVSSKDYTEGKFTRLVVVDFYFLKKIKAKIIRKYRYHSEMKKWDRFFNEYRFYDSTATISK